MPDRRRRRRTAPAITLTVKITTAIVTIPVIIDLERYRRDAELPVVIGVDIDPPTGILGLQVAAGDPAAIARIADVTPVGGGEAAENLDRIASWHDQDRRVLRTGPSPQVDIGRCEGLSRLRGGG